MGISRDSWHKRRKTGGRKPQMHKKRKFELGRPAANTKIAPKRVHTVRAMGGNMKFRALRLDHGNFGWASEGISRTTRIVDVVYNATSNELIRTKTLVKGAIVALDCNPFRQYYRKIINTQKLFGTWLAGRILWISHRKIQKSND